MFDRREERGRAAAMRARLLRHRGEHDRFRAALPSQGQHLCIAAGLLERLIPGDFDQVRVREVARSLEQRGFDVER